MKQRICVGLCSQMHLTLVFVPCMFNMLHKRTKIGGLLFFALPPLTKVSPCKGTHSKSGNLSMFWRWLFLFAHIIFLSDEIAHRQAPLCACKQIWFVSLHTLYFTLIYFLISKFFSTRLNYCALAASARCEPQL